MIILIAASENRNRIDLVRWEGRRPSEVNQLLSLLLLLRETDGRFVRRAAGGIYKYSGFEANSKPKQSNSAAEDKRPPI